MPAIFSRIKNFVAETLTAADINAEFNNILNNFEPAQMDDYSANVAEMQTETDPGEVGSESQATTLSGELERLRYAIREVKGTTEWYETATANVNTLDTLISSDTPPSRLTSSVKVSTSDLMPKYLIANGAAATAAVDATPTNIQVYIDDVLITLTSDATISSLQLAPSSNNTCLVNDTAIADTQSTKHQGEYGTTIAIDTVGSEITSLNGQVAAFKINNGSADEYFLARVDTTNGVLRDCRRGFFFDSSYDSIPRVAIANNDTITLMKIVWVYVTSSSTYIVSYNNPIISKDDPAGPNEGDYWFDLANNKWQRYASGAFAAANATFFGYLVTDSTNCVASRCLDLHKAWSDHNSIELRKSSATVIEGDKLLQSVSVNGTLVDFRNDVASWDITADLESGVSEAASTTYYLYVNEFGETFMSDKIPYERFGDLRGLYHPSKLWRCVGAADNDASSDLGAPRDFGTGTVVEAEVVSTGLTDLQKEIRGGAYSKWEDLGLSTTKNYRRGVWGNNTFVFGSDNTGTAAMTYSKNQGNTFTEVASADGTTSWQGGAYGNATFVFVGLSGTTRTQYSTNDGATWTGVAAAAANDWQDVAFGNDVFVAVSSTGTNRTQRSTNDGASWTAVAAAEANEWNAVAYGNSTFVSVAGTGTNRVQRSTDDGTSWSAVAAAEANTWKDVAFGNSTFIAVSSDGTNRVMRSTDDGASWSTIDIGTDIDLYSVAYGNGVFVAVGQTNTASNGIAGIMSLDAGATWINLATDNDTNPGFVGVAYGQGLFIALKNFGTATPDGIRSMISYEV